MCVARAWTRRSRRPALSQIFVVNFQTLTHNTSDTMARLAAFLGLKSSWGPAAALPESKQRKPPTVMDCATYDKLNAHYEQVGVGLGRVGGGVGGRVGEGERGPGGEVWWGGTESVRACTI